MQTGFAGLIQEKEALAHTPPLSDLTGNFLSKRSAPAAVSQGLGAWCHASQWLQLRSALSRVIVSAESKMSQNSILFL